MTEKEFKLVDALLQELHYGVKRASNSEVIRACSSNMLELHNLGQIVAVRRGIQVIEA